MFLLGGSPKSKWPGSRKLGYCNHALDSEGDVVRRLQFIVRPCEFFILFSFPPIFHYTSYWVIARQHGEQVSPREPSIGKILLEIYPAAIMTTKMVRPITSVKLPMVPGDHKQQHGQVR
jgi:hypothetical protein